jgi:hypothetical protein
MQCFHNISFHVFHQLQPEPGFPVRAERICLHSFQKKKGHGIAKKVRKAEEKRISAANDLTVSATLRPPTFCLIRRATTSSCASEPCRFADFPAERG